MIRVISLVVLVFCMMQYVHAGDYTGNKLLEVLGEDRNGEVVKKVREEYSLDKSLKSIEQGVKLTAAHDSGSVVTAIMLTSSTDINDVKYKPYTGGVPFGITFDDGEKSLIEKLGEAKGSSDETRLKFKKDGITINVVFRSSGRKKIAYIKFTQNVGMIGPYRAPVILQAPKIAEIKHDSIASEQRLVEKTGSAPVVVSEAIGSSIEKAAKPSKSQFYHAIISVIESGEEEMFKDIKRAPSTLSNFWNYKYTYTTSIVIPGEKYNMLYSFPFEKSQLDFVSVLEESNGYSSAIANKYVEVEALLKQDFPLSEGWTYEYIANPEDPHGPMDFELKSAKLGSIVLDNSVNPAGKHVLYLRFLLQYN